MRKGIDVVIVTNATTGDNICVIDYDLYTVETLKSMIGDLFLLNIDNGILIKPGIR